jgi:hypothetical protein
MLVSHAVIIMVIAYL